MTESYPDKVQRTVIKLNKRIAENNEYMSSNPDMKRNIILQEIQRLDIIINSLSKELIQLMIEDEYDH